MSVKCFSAGVISRYKAPSPPNAEIPLFSLLTDLVNELLPVPKTMPQLHGQWRRASSSGFPRVSILEPIDDTSESSFAAAACGRARSSSLGFGIFSERHLDLYFESDTSTSHPSTGILPLRETIASDPNGTVPEVSAFTPNPANEIKALPPANRLIVQNNNSYKTLPQNLEHRRLDWLIHQEFLKPISEQDNVNPENDSASWEPSTSSSPQPYQRHNERLNNTKTRNFHVQSCGGILTESDAREAVQNWRRPNGLLCTRRAKPEGVVATEARNVTIESQRRKEGRGRWRIVKAFFSRTSRTKF